MQPTITSRFAERVELDIQGDSAGRAESAAQKGPGGHKFAGGGSSNRPQIAMIRRSVLVRARECHGLQMRDFTICSSI